MSYASKSASTCKITSIRVNRIYPLSLRNKTIEFVLDASEAIKLARNLIVLACDESLHGDVLVTGHKKFGRLSVLRRETYRTGNGEWKG